MAIVALPVLNGETLQEVVESEEVIFVLASEVRLFAQVDDQLCTCRDMCVRHMDHGFTERHYCKCNWPALQPAARCVAGFTLP